ncbi:putative quinol monooxygenase [Pseudarthrobacter sp. PH31-O2]|nr:putative quinol monooxygenase [Pseudarthrobacter sp. PH31-O2]MDJ0353566.1 putative quinol monooxygenase [Pseudarthrobacter sp. PH31-O2]
MAKRYLQVIAHYRAKPEEVETVSGLLHELSTASRTEAANISYEYFQGVQDKAHFVILERYRDADGFAAHRAQDHFKAIGLGQIIPRLESRQIESYEGPLDD